MKQMLTDAHLSSENTGKVFPPLSPLSPPALPVFNIIYCYSIDQATHKGLVKIGQTTTTNLSETEDKKVVDNRIKHQTNTSGVETTIHWHMRAGFSTVDGKQRTDQKLHEYLEAVYDISPHQFGGTVTAREWFKLDAEEAKGLTKNFTQNGYNKTGVAVSHINPIVLREEQENFVKNTLEAYQRMEKHRLWFAKMRFGKTLTAYSFIERVLKQDTQRNKPLKVAIVTHRPVVEKSWSDECDKVFGIGAGAKIQFSSKSKGTPWSEVNKNESFIRFVSMQDLRGKEGKEGKEGEEWKKKNRELFDIKFDIIIIDESHEGNSTERADEVHKKLKRNFTLHLSGTPFRQMATGDFSDDQIDSFDYIEEQERKENWNDEDGSNPYAGQPKLWINTLNMTKDFKEDYFADGAEDAMFDFNTLWKVSKGKFENLEDIEMFLENITATSKAGNSSKSEIAFMPFSRERKQYLRHTLWVLPSIDACEQLELLLKKNPVFEDYGVINVAGEKEKTPLKTVKETIKARGDVGKTITLTVGKLTTGVTVPEWTGVLMLRNTSSIEFYLQTIFRVQSAWSKGGFIKTDCFVWDFAPDRALKVFTEFANPSTQTGRPVSSKERERLGKFLNYMPVITVADNNQLEIFGVDRVYQEIKRLKGERVVNSGFGSNSIFTPDSGKLPAEVLEAIQKVNLANGNSSSNPKNGTSPEINISSSGGVISSEGRPEPKDETGDEIADPTEDATEVPTTGNTPAKEEQTQEHKETKELEAKEKEEQDTVRNVLKTISVRIPYMIIALMSDATFKNNKLVQNFKLGQLADAIDDESWKEFFGAIDKETFKKLEPAFDEHVLQIAVLAWIETVEKALALLEAGEVDEYAKAIKTIMGKIKNPNKETVLTPYEVVGLVHEASNLGVDSKEWKKIVDTQIEAENNNPVSFYDINAKTGLFPFYATHELFKAYQLAEYKITWQQVVERHIHVNTRTKAAGWVTETILGLSATYKKAENVAQQVRVNHKNMTVADVVELLKALKANEPRKSKGSIVMSNYSVVAATLMLSNKGYLENRKIILDDVEREIIFQALDSMLPHGEHNRADILDRLREMVKRKAEKMNGNEFKFDYVISNPPYQETKEGRNQALPIYPMFVLVGSLLSKISIMIHPLKGLVGSNKHPGEAVLSILESKNFSVCLTEMNSTSLFPTAEIKGGVIVTKFDHNSNISPNPFNQAGIPVEALDILKKVNEADNKNSTKLDSIVYVAGAYKYTEEAYNKLGDLFLDKDVRIVSNDFKKYPSIFVPEDSNMIAKRKYRILGMFNSKRAYRLVQNDYVRSELFGFWKVFVPGANGSGVLGERLSTPLIGAPNEGATQTFITIGKFSSEEEAAAMLKYLKTKFCRLLLGTKKVTQNNPSRTWSNIPTQDFSLESEIDWSLSVQEIDIQLYEKYNLSPENVIYIEAKIAEME